MSSVKVIRTLGTIFPFVLVGDGLGMKAGEAFQFDSVPHNRLLMTFLQAMDCPQDSFGNPDFCGDGVLSDLLVS